MPRVLAVVFCVAALVCLAGWDRKLDGSCIIGAKTNSNDDQQDCVALDHERSLVVILSIRQGHPRGYRGLSSEPHRGREFRGRTQSHRLSSPRHVHREMPS